MDLKKHYTLLIVTLLWFSISFAQENQVETSVDFRIGNTTIESGYNNNAEHFPEIILFLQNIQQDHTLAIETLFAAKDKESAVLQFIDRAPQIITSEAEEWTQQLYLKTNVVGLGMMIANAAVELDLLKHWSLAVPVYYSAWNYFTHTVKFRIFCVQPEIRYWFTDNDGWFIGAHLGLAYYNFAWDGDYRIQDHDRSTPALGGGLGVGYRMPISNNKRWKMEFSLGGGVYDLHYDKFHNEQNGLLVESVKKTFFGIDQVAVSFSYMFDLKKNRR